MAYSRYAPQQLWYVVRYSIAVCEQTASLVFHKRCLLQFICEFCKAYTDTEQNIVATIFSRSGDYRAIVDYCGNALAKHSEDQSYCRFWYVIDSIARNSGDGEYSCGFDDRA